ncbi:MAG: tRNA threonylcarbamoyladenosine dehydratase [Alphaproteobacteria bacterium]|nr:tRNA threonylcarbamoyladenosine dehydratase [Alphaproteobacteria bacterium]
MTRLHRTRLLFGNIATERLRAATVMVVGCGAVGSFVIESLARSGVGHLILVDFDTVEESNINRQLFALDSTLNQPKVLVAKSRIHDINPDIVVDTYNMFFSVDSDISASPDVVVDAIDTVESKVALYKWAHARNIPFISSMGAASKTDISQIRLGRISQTSVCPLAARVRRLVRSESLPDFPVVYSVQSPLPVTGHAKNLGSVITVTGAFGLYIANWVILYITGDVSF